MCVRRRRGAWLGVAATRGTGRKGYPWFCENMVKNRRRKRKRSACTRKEGSVESHSPELSITALNKKALLVPAQAAPDASTASCSTVTEVEGEDVTSIADSPPVPQRLPRAIFSGEAGSTAAGHESLTGAVAQGDVQVHCNGSICDGAMIEELLGGLCAEDVIGSFSVSVSNESPPALCTQDHLDCDAALDRVLPLRVGASLPLSSTPVAMPQSADRTRDAVRSVSPALALSSTSSVNVRVEQSTAVLPQACPSQDMKGGTVSEEMSNGQAKHSRWYPSGTFYGLSSDVKRLLTDTRGITALYG